MVNATEWLYGFFSKKNKIPGTDKDDQINTDIFNAGLVDSFGIIELVTAIESVYKIELRQEDLTDPRFRTIRGLAEIIEENISDRSKHG